MMNEMNENCKEIREFTGSMVLKKVLEGFEKAKFSRAEDGGQIGSKMEIKALLPTLNKTEENMRKPFIAVVLSSRTDTSFQI